MAEKIRNSEKLLLAHKALAIAQYINKNPQNVPAASINLAMATHHIIFGNWTEGKDFLARVAAWLNIPVNCNACRDRVIIGKKCHICGLTGYQSILMADCDDCTKESCGNCVIQEDLDLIYRGKR